MLKYLECLLVPKMGQGFDMLVFADAEVPVYLRGVDYEDAGDCGGEDTCMRSA